MPFVQKIATIMSGPVHMQHAEFRTPISTAAVAPIVEMLTLYFSNDVDQASADTTLIGFIQTIVENAKGFVGYTTGWIIEEVEHEKVEGKGKAYAVAIGWESLEAHMAYRDTQTFKDDIVKVRAIAKGSAVVSEEMARSIVQILLMSASITSSSRKLKP
jgi:heme-degrading monooxygenase HmoA